MNREGKEPVIAVDGLTKVFGRFTAVDRLRFNVERGEIFGFLGPNGAGKSTTIRMLCGLLSSTAGTATVGGYDINRDPEAVRQNIGYMSQKFSLYKDLTVAENIAFFGGVYGLARPRLRERAGAVVRLAGLDGLEDRLAGTLSGAHQQRLALGCAILHEPPILFLDEPTSGVDPISRRHFWDLIQDLAGRGVTILVTTHFMDEAEFCGRIGFISGGRLVALDTPAAIKRDAVREDLYEVSLADMQRARERVEAVPGVVATSYFGRHLHVFGRPGELTAEGLGRALAEGGMTVNSVERVPVSLEDAFIRLAATGREAAA
ncbi:MAG TPA: ABC transporter ATP-binding protein [Kiritimatiellia bacterium]|nr:ABC transporter ATP-binding protein [Kiritimatiellia bacterium]HRZ12319.1 ABC transporter ATP-binding protein [Kiritimatiellia bacterium]HSA17923.1 ABC transporter ATP-binding protein [Kiritimatiellia bacterium]